MFADSNRLRVFTEVARLGSFSGAAARLHLTPSAVSHAIGRLEEEVGRPLVRFVARRVQLTDAGLRLFEVSDRSFGQLEEVQLQLASGTVAEHFTLGCTVEFGTAVLVRKLAPLLRAAPELRVHFHFSNELAAPLLAGDVDLIVDCRVHLHPQVETIELFREKYVVVAAPELVARFALRAPEDLGAVPVLSMDLRCTWWEKLMRTLPPTRRPAFSHVLELNHLRGMIGAACEGLGVALVPRYSVARELATGCLTEVFALALEEDRFCIYQRASLAGRGKNRRMVDFLKRLSMEEFADAITPVHEAGSKTTGRRKNPATGSRRSK